ncbi:MAG: VWA domain-containing protein [Firmicutes bacterium]|nr:VWA domain-containing protein [Bacillota bacterium]
MNRTIELIFEQPGHWAWLLLLIPAVILTVLPFLLIKKERRYNRNRVASLIIRLIALVLVVVALSGMTFQVTDSDKKNEVVFLVDCSESTKPMRDKMDKFLEDALNAVVDERVGVVAFGYGTRATEGLSTNGPAVFNRYKGWDLTTPRNFVEATNIEKALDAAESLFTKDKDKKVASGRVVILSDGAETDGKALIAATKAAGRGMRVDTVYFEPPLRETGQNLVEVQINSLTIRQTSVKKGDVGDIVVALGATSAASGYAAVKLTWAPVNANMEIGAETTIRDAKGATVDAAGLASVRLTGDGGQVSYSHRFDNLGLTCIKAEVSYTGDGMAQNNTYYTFVNIITNDKVLIIEGKPGDAQNLSNLIGDEYTVHVRQASVVKGWKMSDLREYDEVILLNVDPKELGDFVALLDEYVYKLGGCLVTAGGDNMYNEKQVDPKDPLYSEQAVALEKMLPVEYDASGQPLALCLVIDLSTSTCAPVRTSAGGKKPYDDDMIGSRLWAEAEGAKAAVDALLPGDYVGIIQFNSNAKQVLGMTPATRKTEIYNAINNMTTSQGTIYSQGIAMAANMMAGVTFTERKHIIFLTDGLPLDGDNNILWTVNKTIQAMKRNGTTLTTVGIGNELDRADARYILQSMADDGWGIPTSDPRYGVPGNYGAGERHFLGIRDIPGGFRGDTRVTTFMSNEIKELYPTWKNDATTNPIIGTNGGIDIQIKSSISTVTNDVSAFPKIGGFYGVKAKGSRPDDPPESKGRTILSTPEGYPLYVEWDYGAGRVASWMSTLNGDAYSDKYLGAAAEQGGKEFVMNIVRSMMADKPVNLAGDVTFDKEKSNFLTYFRVGGLEANLKDLDAKVYGAKLPNGGVNITNTLIRIGVDSFEGSFESADPGIYKLVITNKGALAVEEYFAFSYSKEFNAFPSADYRNECQAFMNKMWKTGPDGMSFMIEDGGAAIFGPTAPTQTVYPPLNLRVIFMIIAVCLFLLDIAARKFKFKWPSEWGKRAANAR